MKARSTINSRAQPGFTLIELSLVVAIISILATLLFRALGRASTSARSASCKNNLRQIGIALRLYTDEFGTYPVHTFTVDRFSSGQDWDALLLPFTGSNPRLFRCPSHLQWWTSDWAVLGQNNHCYGYNFHGTGPDSSLGLGGLVREPIPPPVPESNVLVPSDMIAIGDGLNGLLLGFGWSGLPPELVVPRKDLHCNAVFCDGHVEASPTEHLPRTGSLSEGNLAFSPDEMHARRWNSDNQAHPEMWPQSPANQN